MVPQLQVDTFFAALCCWKEARGEVEASKIAALWVMKNRMRAHWIGDVTVQDVVGRPYQFSALTAPGDPNLIKWPRSSDGAWLDCLRLAELVLTDRIPDPTFGATFYHDVSMSGPAQAWGPVMETYRCGRLVFYRGC